MADTPTLPRRLVLLTPLAGLAAASLPEASQASALEDGGLTATERRTRAIKIRDDATQQALGKAFPDHPTNGDEDEITVNGAPTYIANYSKGLPHNEYGEVDPAAYRVMLDALASGKPEAFEIIPLGALSAGETAAGHLPEMAQSRTTGTRFYRAHAERALLSADSQQMRLVDPQAALAFDLEGGDSHGFAIPAPPSFRSKEIIGEIAESYWMALARDVPFNRYGAAPGAPAQAIAALQQFAEFRGPEAKDAVSPQTLFRDTGPGNLVGPYVSQFLVLAIPFGAYQLPQKVVFSFPNDPVFMITAKDWLDRQRGMDPGDNPTLNPTPKYIYRGRDLTSFVHIDELFQAYLNAALLMGAPPARGGLGALHNRGNPYDGYVPGTNPPMVRVSTQVGFGTLGEPNIKSVVAEVATRALKAVWYEKWSVHRRLRPEVFAGRVHFQRSGARHYPFDPAEFAKLTPTLDAVEAFNTSKKGEGVFLPMAFPEGSPLHPSYGAGHATVAAACATILKGFYEGSLTFADLKAPIYIPSDDGTTLHNLQMGDFAGYSYDDLSKRMTLGGEIDKLASNVSLGRNFAGVHWRSDHTWSIKLGEAVGLELLQQFADTYNERISFHLRKFNGHEVVITKI